MNSMGKKASTQNDVEKEVQEDQHLKSTRRKISLKKAEARIKYLEAELEFLKKLDELERQAIEEEKITTREKFMLIEQIIRQYNLANMVSYFCEMAEVSRSGYYAWLHAGNIRLNREEKRLAGLRTH